VCVRVICAVVTSQKNFKFFFSPSPGTVHMCYMNHSCVWYYWFMSLMWLISRWHGRFIKMCDMNHSKCVIWIIPSVRHDSFICVTWLMHMCDMTHSSAVYDNSCVRCDSFIFVTKKIFICVTQLIHMHPQELRLNEVIKSLTHRDWQQQGKRKHSHAHP